MHVLKRTFFRLIMQVFLLLTSAVAQAAVVSDAAILPGNPGVPIHQRFLPSGASVVTTRDTRACVVSQRLEIEKSTYLDVQGAEVDFEQILRSPAASLQAISTVPGEITFRLQLKYSIGAGIPIMLSIGDGQEDVQASLEKSTDSLLLTGETATRLETAFRDGIVPVLSSHSVDNGHLVTDAVTAPDLEALEACTLDLAEDPLGTEEVDNAVRLIFHADPLTTPLATLPQLRACRMQDEPGELHLAGIEETNGFFSQTDQVFVAFAEDGSIARAYVPGVFDGNFTEGRNTVRLSIAADSNVPTAQNDVKGCLGMAEIPLCSFDLEEGQRRITPCLGEEALAMFPDATGYVPDFALPDLPVASGTGNRTGARARQTRFGSRPGAGAFTRVSADPSPSGFNFFPGIPVIQTSSSSPRQSANITALIQPVIKPVIKVPTDIPKKPPVTKPGIPKGGDPDPGGTGEKPDLPIVPLPPALLMFFAALASLIALRRRTAIRARKPVGGWQDAIQARTVPNEMSRASVLHGNLNTEGAGQSLSGAFCVNGGPLMSVSVRRVCINDGAGQKPAPSCGNLSGGCRDA